MIEKIKVVLVDDEELALNSLREMLRSFGDIEVLRECRNGFEAIQAISELAPDILFLDIQMPKLDGFDVAELLGDDAPFIVFVTAYDEYAIRAFETEALDYLLKPVQKDRLSKTLARARDKVRANHKESIKDFVRSQQSSFAPLSRILIKEGLKVHIIQTDDITHLEAQDDYVAVFTEKGYHLKNEKLSNMEAMLEPRQFCRIHRSYILNIDYLDRIEPYSKDSKLAILKTGKKLPISRTGYKKLMKFI